MSITSTRKVSVTSVVSSKQERTYPLGGPTESFVEQIDTNNNVSVGSDFDENNRNQAFAQNSKKSEDKKQKSKEKEVSLSNSVSYTSNTLEALEASGVFETEETYAATPNVNVNKIGIYDNNQSMIDADNNEKRKQNSLKNLYENNQLIEEVDKLI